MSELSVDLHPTPGFIHVVLAVWVPEKGWLTTTPAPSHMPPEMTIEDKVAFKAKAGARAMVHALTREEEAPKPQLPMFPTGHGGTCSSCGGMTRPTGSCETCMVCGTSAGCS